MILLKWAAGAAVVVDEEPAGEGAVEGEEAGYELGSLNRHV